jgi:hemin uptake protein HemP
MIRIYHAAMTQKPTPQPVVRIPPQPAVISAASLLRGQRELIIEHAGERYRLSLTKNGKLILTK